MCRTHAWELRQQRGMCVPQPSGLGGCRVSLVSHLMQYHCHYTRCGLMHSWGWLPSGWVADSCSVHIPRPQTSLKVTNRW